MEKIKAMKSIATAAMLLIGACGSNNPSSQNGGGEPSSCSPSGSLASPAPSGDVLFPPGSVINVKDYGARGDGLTDDTQAISRAIRENIGPTPAKTLYLPSGTYVVSDRLEWRDSNGDWQPNFTFQGQNRDTTIIRLKDNTPGYEDPSKPRAVLFTASARRTSGSVDWTGLGEGNEAFRNHIFDLTVLTGSGNPGAIGIDYLASNMGAIRNVSIRSCDGAGHSGLELTRHWPGPCFIKNVQIEGFDHGIHAGQAQYGVTFEHITLARQKVAGIRNEGNVLSIRGLTSTNSVPAVQNLEDRGLITLIDGRLEGGSNGVSAIENSDGHLYARNVTASGYRSAIAIGGTALSGMAISEFSSLPPFSLFDSPAKSLTLTVQETPEVPRDPLSQWASVTDFGADGNNNNTFDNTPAFQRAIDSGASTIYVPAGRYLLSDTVHIRGNARRLDFMDSWIGTTRINSFGGARPIFKVEEGTPPVVMIERIGSFWDVGSTTFPTTGVEHASTRTLVIRNGGGHVRTNPGSGPLFLEDVGAGRVECRSQNVWARQLNTEGLETVESYILNDAGNVWILGIKTEKPNTVMRTIGGGRTELLGGLVFPVFSVPSDLPAFINEESSHSLIYVMNAYDLANNYEIQVKETRGGVTRMLLKRDLPRRGGGGSTMPLYVGYTGS